MPSIRIPCQHFLDSQLSRGFINLACTALLASQVYGKLNDFSRKPVIGFNTYNNIACSPNASYVEERLGQLTSLGFLDVGYRLFHLDCGWAGFNRTENGSLTWDPTRFPNGISPLSDKARSMGFDWGMYTDTGYYMCDTAGFEDVQRPASRDYELADAERFALWNAVYVKGNHDPRTDYVERYARFSDAFNEVGIPGLSVCQWAVPYVNPQGILEGPSEWTSPVATSFRVADDVYHSYDTIQRVWNEALHVNYFGRNGPGNFMDMDILEVGQDGMTVSEQKSHFAIWAYFKSTLLASTNLANPSQDTLDTLPNRDIINIHQDDLAKPVLLVQRFSDDHDLYAGPLVNGDKAVLMVDLSGASHTIGFNFSQIGIKSATVKNLWTGDIVISATSYMSTVDSHGSIPLRLSDVVTSPPTSPPRITWYESERGQFTGSAQPANCTGCSGGKRVTSICDESSSVTLRGIKAHTRVLDLYFDYVNTQFSVDNDRHNVRGATITVNGGKPQNVEFPFTGYDDQQAIWKNYLVRLEGFSAMGDNTIVIKNRPSLTACAPDVDRIGVAQ